MFRSKFLNILMSFLVIASMTLGTTGQVVAKNQSETPAKQAVGGGTLHGKVTPAERQAAADRLKAAYKKAGISTQAAGVLNPGGVPDYFGTTPNYANSPLPTLDAAGNPLPGTGMRKFMDTLPGLTSAGANNLLQYLPLAVSDTTTYPGSDYYEIAVVQYSEKLHTDLPPTTLRGYVQISTTVVPGAHIQLFYPDGVTPILDNKGAPVYAVDKPQYLGPVILARSYDPTKPAGVAGNGQPTRIKFDNYLPTGVAGDLYIPVDTSAMGAGMGPTGEVTGISILTGGAGYTSVPTVTISGGTTGVNATAAATILNGVVNSLHITNPGTLYTSAPTVVISGGGATTDATASLSWIGAAPAAYTENRATLHLHGGVTPWISDGTPDQWTTPATEGSPYPEGVSTVNVPDMPDPGPGSMTFFYTNEQSARLMFYHDHAYGITRLNVYGGEAAGYVLQDATVQAMVANGTLPPDSNMIPLVIQDKTFVPDPVQLANEDPTWPTVGGGMGNFWFPHVYMPNQNPFDMAGVNAMGRWDYGPWFWPPYTGLINGTVPNPLSATTPTEGPVNPGTPNPSMVPEGFMDTPLVNGTAYPVLNVNPAAYRFQILNAANDRMWNLQLYQTSPIVSKLTLTSPGSGYTDAPTVTITSATGDPGQGATALATVDTDPLSATFGQVIGLEMWTVGSGYIATPTVTIAPPTTLGGTTATATATVYSAPTEVGMVPFTSSQNAISAFPSTWYTAGNPFTMDDRVGGVPDPTKRGPAFVQIASEGGIMPNPVVVKNQPVNYVYNRRDIVVLNVAQKALMLGPAERADVVVDFSNFAGKTLILYNDSPAPMPAADPRNDYFTGSPDWTSQGGAPSTLPGYGPNTRTIMKIVVAAGASSTAPVDDVNAASLAGLKTALPAAFAASQPAPVVPEAAYNAAYGVSYTNTYARISDSTMTYTPAGAAAPITLDMQPKAIQELFEVNYGRMNATLGVEIPNSNATIQTTIPLGYIDPATELLKAYDGSQPIGTLSDGTQIWRITHNGVDTHALHFHLFNVQVINRVGWDGAIRPPDANEIGWKDTVRMSPLEDIVVALRPILPIVPFAVPNSIRALDVTNPIGSTMGYFGVDPSGNPITVVNQLINFGWEYVWHCHLLGHEENDMMRPMMLAVPPSAPTTLTSTPAGGPIRNILSWANTANNATTFVIQRATDSGFTTGLTTFDSGGNLSTYTDTAIVAGTPYFYRVAASNVVGGGVGLGSNPSLAANSAWSNTSLVGGSIPADPTGLSATALLGGTVRLTWTDNATNETSFEIQRADNGGAMTSLAAVVPANPGTGIVNFVDTTTGGPNSYVYQVRAVNVVGNSGWTVPTASVTLPALPAAPTGLTATLPVAGQVLLSWVNNATNQAAFSIERNVNGGPFTVLATPLNVSAQGAAVTYADTTVIAGTTYGYQVRAVNTGGYSAYAGPVSILVGVPAAPTNLVGVYQSAPVPQIALSWNDNAVNEMSYVVERADNGGAFVSIANLAAYSGTGLVGYNDTTVLDNNSYAYRVKAVNGFGSSAYSNSVTVITPPAAPSNVLLTLVNGGIQVTFTDNAIYETSFNIVRNINGTYVFLTSLPANPGTGTVTYTDLTTLGATAYGYLITAVNASGTSAVAYSAIVTTSASPATPTNLTATLQNGGVVRIRFTDRSTNETAFLLERSLNGGAFAVIATIPAQAGSGATITYNDATGVAGNTYGYRLRAVALGSSSAYTAVATVSLPALPPAPTGLTALPAATRAVTLSWTDNALTETGFSVERSVNGGAFTVLATLGVHAGTGITTYNDASAVAGTAYVYQVRAFNLGGYSAYSNTAALTPAAPPTLTGLASTVLQTSATQSMITLTWVDPLTETSFTVQQTNASFTTALRTTTLPANTALYQRTGMRRPGTYYFRVRATNGYGSSAWSTITVVVP